MKTPIYMDYAAATPVDERVIEQMVDCLRSGYGNPASTAHQFGRDAGEMVDTARAQVAKLINAAPEEIIFTSGATEADNLALIGAARFRSQAGRHIVTSVAEHPAVLESCRYLETEGFSATYLTPDANGIIEPAAVQSALQSGTVLVSIMHVNNEIGVVQDIAAIGRICRDADILFHVDAAQSAGRLSIDVRSQSIDLLSLSGQKIYGPKGVGALFMNRQRVRRIEPLFHGGGQERGLRPGTVATHQVAGMGLACEIARARRVDDAQQIEELRKRLWRGLKKLPGVLLNGHPKQRVCHILSVSVTGVEGESLHYGLCELAVSAGSACATETDEPSLVLRSLGRSDQLARSTVRFSLGRQTSEAEIDFAIAQFSDVIARLRALAPVSEVQLA
ncbi:MAG: aminotransferase class V-fold PLP-dependent enzyme [Gammaproteobacteria bacterium]|nr:aminotransferase class V-fold PLP-dependent enzyme [Gammaproteobacteria bacterium]